jgi:hypothetical protein
VNTPSPDGRVIVSFGRADAAANTARRLERRGVAPGDLRIDHIDDLAVVGRGRQRVEARDLTVAVAPGMGRPDQLVPGWLWAAVGFVTGFVVFAAVGAVVPIGDLGAIAAAALVGLCGGLGGAATGFVYGLSRGPELAGEGRDAPAGSVLSLPASAVERDPGLLDLVAEDPEAAVWRGPVGVRTRRSGTSDHPDAGVGPRPRRP